MLNDLIKEHHINEMLCSVNQLPPLSQIFAFNMLHLALQKMETLKYKSQALNNELESDQARIKEQFQEILGVYFALYHFLVKQEPLFWQKFEEALQHLHQPITEIKQVVKVPVLDNGDSTDTTQTYPINGFLSMNYQKCWDFQTHYNETELIYALEWRKNCDFSYSPDVRLRYNWETKEIKVTIGIKDTNGVHQFDFDDESYNFKNKHGKIIQSYITKINENGQHVLLKIEPHQPELTLLSQTMFLPILNNLECINTNAKLFNGVYTFNNANELSLWLSQLLEQYGSLIGNVKTDFSSELILKLIQAYFPSPNKDSAYPLSIKLEDPLFPSNNHYAWIMKRKSLERDYFQEEYAPIDSIHQHIGGSPFLWGNRLRNCLAQCVFFDKALGVERMVFFYYDFNYHAIFMYSTQNGLGLETMSIDYLYRHFWEDFNQLCDKVVLLVP